MSSPSASPPDGIHCADCGEWVKYAPCRSSGRGNKGRPVATCHKPRPDGSHCNFIRWQPGSSKSPSPTLASSASFPPSQPLLPASLPPVPPSQPVTGCSVSGCGQSRLAGDCSRKLCRKHCVVLGGCDSKTHRASLPPAATAYQPPSSALSTYATVAPAVVASEPIMTPPLLLPTQTAEIFPEVLDARPNPRFASHLRPIFTEQHAREYEFQEQKRADDAARLANRKKSKQQVVVYAWSAPDAAPSIRYFQDGFVWPFFLLAPDVLTLVGLSSAADQQNLQMYDEQGLDTWVDIDAGFAIEVKEGQAVFLRDRAVEDPRDFEKQRRAHEQTLPTHIRFNLPSNILPSTLDYED